MGSRTTLACRNLVPRATGVSIRRFGGHGDPRAHLNPDGTRPETEDAEDYHDPDPAEHSPGQILVKERGKTWVKSYDPPKSAEELFGCTQENVPFMPRARLNIWANYKLLMKAEYCYFYLPTILIFGLVVPAFSTIYAADEAVESEMVVKLIGRQWYWVYEVESPTDDDEE